MIQRQAQGQLEKERQQLCNFREAYQRRIREHGHPLKRSYGETKVNQRLEQARGTAGGTSSQESDTAGCEQGEARPWQRGRPAARGCHKRPRRRCTITLSDAQTQTDKLGRGCSPGRSSSCFSLPSTSGQASGPRPGPSPSRRKGSGCNSSQSSVEGGGRASSVEGEEEEEEESSSSSQCSTPSSVSCSEEQVPAAHKQAGGLCTATELVLARPPDKVVAMAGPGYPPRGDRRKLSSA
eukprot:g29756.t1